MSRRETRNRLELALPGSMLGHHEWFETTRNPDKVEVNATYRPNQNTIFRFSFLVLMHFWDQNCKILFAEKNSEIRAHSVSCRFRNRLVRKPQNATIHCTSQRNTQIVWIDLLIWQIFIRILETWWWMRRTIVLGKFAKVLTTPQTSWLKMVLTLPWAWLLHVRNGWKTGRWIPSCCWLSWCPWALETPHKSNLSRV